MWDEEGRDGKGRQKRQRGEGERKFVGRLEEEVVGGMREEEIITPSSFAHATKRGFSGGVKGGRSFKVNFLKIYLFI